MRDPYLYLGLDLGTTSVSAAVIDLETGHVLRTQSLPHHAAIMADVPGAHTQDADTLVTQAQRLVAPLTAEFGPFSGIGVTGQMHGILYVDAAGQAVSPLFTWLDRQAEGKNEGKGYLEHFQDLTGEAVSTGYGAVTHFTQLRSGRIPKTAASLCTAPDYLVMRLCGLTHPLTDPTLAHSLGLFSLEQLSFKDKVWKELGSSPVKLPTVSVHSIVAGRYEGTPVVTALGDNQASFIGSIGDPERSALVTLGTSGQVSCVSNELKYADGLETRPFPDNRFLLVGASLTGGKALEMLAKLVAEIAYKLSGEHLADPYKLLESDPGKLRAPYLEVNTRFAGSRSSVGGETGARTGSIRNITPDNFTLEHLTYGFAQGVVDELYSFWQGGLKTVNITNMVGSGNVLRRSSLVREQLQKTFGLPLTLTPHREEAAVGAALYAAATVQEEPLEAVSQKLFADE